MSIQRVLNSTRTWHVETTDVLAGLRQLPDNSVQCVVTSPPYWGLRDYGVEGQLGLEKTPREFVDVMVGVFEEVRRVLRPDGTLWMNIGDSYAAGGNGGQHDRQTKTFNGHKARAGDQTNKPKRPTRGYKAKDLVGVPWLLAFGLRDAGWYLRSEIIWHKRSPMPESVRDRPTKSHEQIFLFSKSPKYFYDAVASAEAQSQSTIDRYEKNDSPNWSNAKATTAVEGECRSNSSFKGAMTKGIIGSRNMRTVWTLSSEPFSEAHFATYPTELVRRCLLAGTSAKGCCATCGAPWRRLVKRTFQPTQDPDKPKGGDKGMDQSNGWGSVPRGRIDSATIGWKATCACQTAAEPLPCLVLDPFSGAGTTGVTARRLGLRYVWLELNPEYAAMSRRRIVDDQPLMNAS